MKSILDTIINDGKVITINTVGFGLVIADYLEQKGFKVKRVHSCKRK